MCGISDESERKVSGDILRDERFVELVENIMTSRKDSVNPTITDVQIETEEPTEGVTEKAKSKKKPKTNVLRDQTNQVHDK